MVSERSRGRAARHTHIKFLLDTCYVIRAQVYALVVELAGLSDDEHDLGQWNRLGRADDLRDAA